MLQNAYLLAKIGADTAENERNFAEILPKIGNYPTGRLRRGRLRRRPHDRAAPLRERRVLPLRPVQKYVLTFEPSVEQVV